MFDMNEFGSTAIISSTDFCDEKVVSALCKVMTPRDDEEYGIKVVKPQTNRLGMANSTNSFSNNLAGQSHNKSSRFAAGNVSIRHKQL